MTIANPFVRRLVGYAPLCNSEIQLLLDACSAQKKFRAHRDLIREGDEPGPVFVMLEGWASRYKILPDGSRQIMAFMMPGDFCDLHIGSLEQMDHGVGAISNCLVAVIPHDRMEELIVATPSLTRAFWRAQLIDESVLRAWIVSMGRRSATQRVAHLMLELYIRMRNIGLTTDERCAIPLSQLVVADALGLTAVHVNRVLQALRNVMKLKSGVLEIYDITSLAKIAGFDDNYLHRRIRQTS